MGLALGVTFTYVTPALVAPDEYTHLAAAYELASTWSGQTAADEDGNLLLRECDAAHFGTKTGDIGVLAYKNEAIAETSEPGSPDVLTTHSQGRAAAAIWPRLWASAWRGRRARTFTRCCSTGGWPT